MGDLMTDFQHLDVQDLDRAKLALSHYASQVLSGTRQPTVRSLQKDVLQLCEITRVMIDRVQHLEAMVEEVRE